MSLKENLGGMMLAWENEGEGKLRSMSVDLVPLVELSERESWPQEKVYDRIQGFLDAFEVIATNYNVFPRTAPMDQETFRLLQKTLQAQLAARVKMEVAQATEGDASGAESDQETSNS